MASDYYPTSPYLYCGGDPINLIDPTGENPVYDMAGNFLGCTSEGFTGMIMFYTGTEFIDPTQYTLSELQSSAGNDLITFDEARESNSSGILESAYSRIWTHVASQFEGLQVYDEVFSMSSIDGGKIGYKQIEKGEWETIHYPERDDLLPIITGSGTYPYESTVENIASSIIVHEFYSHGKKHCRFECKSHRLAYKNVINFKQLWNKTTDKYKAFNLNMLLRYTRKETGRKQVDKPYRRLYNKYVIKE